MVFDRISAVTMTSMFTFNILPKFASWESVAQTGRQTDLNDCQVALASVPQSSPYWITDTSQKQLFSHLYQLEE